MSNFIRLTDYDASIHTEILDALTRSDASIIEICEERAIAEMKSYLSARYDVDALFGATGDQRNTLVLMMAIDISIYHIFCIHNPQKLSKIRVDRYERAVEWLKAVAACKVSVDGAPLLPEDTRAKNAPSLMNSNTKRDQHI
jgi:phage gp36-like protein